MRLGYMLASEEGATNRVLREVAEALSARGMRLCGTVQINTPCAGGGPCDMDVRVLPDGPLLRISQSLGRGSTGCRLDPEALERAVAASARVLPEAEVLLVNKFGKQEALGRGFRPLIAEALERGLPVLVGLNALNRAAFDSFTGGLAEELPADPALLAEWVTRVPVA